MKYLPKSVYFWFFILEIKADSIREIAKLWYSPHLRNIIEQVDKFDKVPRNSSVLGPVESDPEYQLIVEANNCAAEIDNEIGMTIQTCFMSKNPK